MSNALPRGGRCISKVLLRRGHRVSLVLLRRGQCVSRVLPRGSHHISLAQPWEGCCISKVLPSRDRHVSKPLLWGGHCVTRALSRGGCHIFRVPAFGVPRTHYLWFPFILVPSLPAPVVLLLSPAMHPPVMPPVMSLVTVFFLCICGTGNTLASLGFASSLGGNVRINPTPFYYVSSSFGQQVSLFIPSGISSFCFFYSLCCGIEQVVSSRLPFPLWAKGWPEVIEPVVLPCCFVFGPSLAMSICCLIVCL